MSYFPASERDGCASCSNGKYIFLASLSNCLQVAGLYCVTCWLGGTVWVTWLARDHLPTATPVRLVSSHKHVQKVSLAAASHLSWLAAIDVFSYPLAKWLLRLIALCALPTDRKLFFLSHTPPPHKNWLQIYFNSRKSTTVSSGSIKRSTRLDQTREKRDVNVTRPKLSEALFYYTYRCIETYFLRVGGAIHILGTADATIADVYRPSWYNRFTRAEVPTCFFLCAEFVTHCTGIRSVLFEENRE